MRGSLKALAICLGGVVVLTAIASVVTSTVGTRLARKYLEEHSQELIHRDLSIQNISVSLLGRCVSVSGLRVKERDGVRNFIEADSLGVCFSLSSLLFHKAKVTSLYVRGLRVNIEQRGMKFNFSDIIDDASASSSGADAASEPSNWKVELQNIQLRECGFRYADLVLHSEYRASRIALDIPEYELSGQPTRAGLDLSLDGGGSLSLRLDYNKRLSEYSLKASVRQLPLLTVLPYLRLGVLAGDIEGTADVDMLLKAKAEHVADFVISGSSSLNNVVLFDDGGEEVLSLDSSSATLRGFCFKSGVLHLGDVVARGLRLRSVASDSTNSLARFFKPLLAADSSAATGPAIVAVDGETDLARINTSNQDRASKSFSVIIDHLDVSSSEVVYRDPAHSFDYLVSNICIGGSNINLEGISSITASCSLAKSGKASLKFRGRVGDSNSMNVALRVKNVQMQDFSPLFRTEFGYDITRGFANFNSDVAVSGGSLSSDNQITAFDFEVDKVQNLAENPEFKAPLKTVLYVLKDKNGVIDLSVPVSGSLSDPSFRFRKALMHTLKGLLLKVSASPFKAVGRLFSHNGDDALADIAIDASLPVIPQSAYSQLSSLASALNQKPELTLSVRQTVNNEVASRSLAMQMLKTDFFLAQNPEASLQDLSLADEKAIRAISDKDKNLRLYAAGRAGSEGQSACDLALRIYADTIAKSLDIMAKKRELEISEFFARQTGSSSRVSVSTLSTIAGSASAVLSFSVDQVPGGPGEGPDDTDLVVEDK